MLTVAEAFANANCYATHLQIAQFSQGCGCSREAIFNMFLSYDTAYNRRSSSATYAIKVFAKETTKPYMFPSQFHLAFSSVIGLLIFTVYPNISGISSIKVFVLSCILREHFLEDGSIVAADPIHIMWTRPTHSPLCGWTDNHFTPLIPFWIFCGTAILHKLLTDATVLL